MDESKKFIYYENDKGEMVAKLNEGWKEHLQREKLAFFIRRSEIPKDYHHLEFDSFPWVKARESIEHCKTYCAGAKEDKFQGVSLYLHGGPASGKTTAACAIGKEFIKKGYYVKFVFAGHLQNLLLKTTTSFTDADAQKQLDEYRNADLLIIKDAFDSKKILTGKTSEAKETMNAALYSYLQGIISRENRIVFVSSLAPLEIQNLYGKSMFELIDLHTVTLKFEDSVRHIKKDKLKELFVN